MKWILASEEVPGIWYAHGSASKRLNLLLHGEYPNTGRYFKENNREYFELSDKTIFEKESFHLIQWLDRSPSPSSTVEPVHGSVEAEALPEGEQGESQQLQPEEKDVIDTWRSARKFAESGNSKKADELLEYCKSVIGKSRDYKTTI
jgi:hypothetical protein